MRSIKMLNIESLEPSILCIYLLYSFNQPRYRECRCMCTSYMPDIDLLRTNVGSQSPGTGSECVQKLTHTNTRIHRKQRRMHTVANSYRPEMVSLTLQQCRCSMFDVIDVVTETRETFAFASEYIHSRSRFDAHAKHARRQITLTIAR